MPLLHPPKQYLSPVTKKLMTDPFLDVVSGSLVDASEISDVGTPMSELRLEIEQFRATLLSETEFIQAILDNNLDLLKQKNYPPEYFTLTLPNQNGIRNALEFALFNQHHELAQHLIENEFPLNNPDNMDFTPLHFAAIYGNLNVVKMICERAPTLLNRRNNLGNTALHYAANEGRGDIVDYLLEAGAKSYFTDNPKTPFINAVGSNHLTIAKRLMAQGPMSLGNFDSPIANPLAVCVEVNAIELVVRLFKDLAAQRRPRFGLETQDVNGLTPLHVAVKNNYVEMAALLIANGANVNTKDKQGNTLLHTAAVNFDGISVLDLLIKAGTAVDYNQKKQTPIDVAHLTGRLDNKALIVQYIIDTDKKNNLEKQANEILTKRFADQEQKNDFEQLKSQQNEIFKLLAEIQTNQTKLAKGLNEINAKIDKIEKNTMMEKPAPSKGLFRF